MNLPFSYASFPFLSILIWLPILGSVILALLPGQRAAGEHGHITQNAGGRERLSRWVALVFSLLSFVISLVMLFQFDKTSPAFQFVEQAPWISQFGISYTLGLDGISLFLVALTTFLMPIVVMASHSVHKSLKGYLASMFVLQSAMIGTLVSLDLFLFYVFWELMLAPMYFIIGIWGGKRRIYASLKFVLYTVFGSVLLFLGLFYLVWVYVQQTGGQPSFLLSDLLKTHLSLTEQVWLFAAFAIAFGIKVPIFPFHTWLPDAHVEAPTGGSVVLAGVLLKMGIYGFIRFAYPLFPGGAEVFAGPLVLLAVIGIIYGALVAWVQSDIKKLVAYSSVSHLGYCVLGMVALNTVATSGSIYQMLNHGVSTGALFLLVGVLYDRKHTRMMSDYQGLAAQVPLFAFLFMVFMLSSIALPLTNGFVGEYLILSGSFQRFPVATTVAVLGVILGAVYMLTLYLRTMFGELNQQKNGDLEDVTGRELVMFIPLLILVFVMGIFSAPFLSRIEPSVAQFLSVMNERASFLRRAVTAVKYEGDPQEIHPISTGSDMTEAMKFRVFGAGYVQEY
jgi:NADH-quinone oxidoreductase subunit M